jgi:hypothetical protein
MWTRGDFANSKPLRLTRARSVAEICGHVTPRDVFRIIESIALFEERESCRLCSSGFDSKLDPPRSRHLVARPRWKRRRALRTWPGRFAATLQSGTSQSLRAAVQLWFTVVSLDQDMVRPVFTHQMPRPVAGRQLADR